MTGLRLQLVLAKAGVASRRAAETLITSGRVAINGRIERELGVRVDPIADRITVDGREVRREPPAYFFLNKPKGYVTTASDPEGRPTVFDLVQQGGLRLFAVGRLDFNTEGALLLTNDGELAHALMHPSRGVEKVYHAKLRYHVTAEQLDRLRRGIVLPPARVLDAGGRPTTPSYPLGGKRPPVEKPERSAPCEVAVIKETGQHTWVEFILHEGKNRQIHRMAEAIGSSLLKLLRVEYSGLSIETLKVGESRPLTSKEIATLRRGVGLTPQLDEAELEPAEAPSSSKPSSSKPPGAKPPAAKPFGAKPNVRGTGADRPPASARNLRDGMDARPPQPRPFEPRPSQQRPPQQRPPQQRPPQQRPRNTGEKPEARRAKPHMNSSKDRSSSPGYGSDFRTRSPTPIGT